MHIKCPTMPRNLNDKPSISDLGSIKSKNEYSTDVKLLAKHQLLELLDRQNNLIKRIPLAKLPDKGEKVKKLKKEIEDELERRNNTQDLSDVLSNLAISEKKIDLLEWGEKDPPTSDKKNEVIEDESNPFAILATHSGTNYNKKKVQVEKEEEPLIKLADIEEAYALNLCNKIDKAEQPKKKFLPHKTLVSHSISTKHKLRDLSAATPPDPVFGDAKLITLGESIKLQFEQTKHLKEVQMRHATERLKEMRYRMGNDLPSGESSKTYRNVVEELSDEEVSEKDSDQE